jgi:hypothetical protein
MKPTEQGKPPTAKSAAWERFYTPSDPSDYQKMFGQQKSQKVRDAHVFPIKAIEAASKDAYALAERIRGITNRVTLSPYIPPQPVF